MQTHEVNDTGWSGGVPIAADFAGEDTGSTTRGNLIACGCISSYAEGSAIVTRVHHLNLKYSGGIQSLKFFLQVSRRKWFLSKLGSYKGVIKWFKNLARYQLHPKMFAL
jgi:hypothetical protein